MIKLRFKHFTVRLYTDPMEFMNMIDKPFGKFPKGTKVAEFEIEHMTGFVNSKDNVIRILAHPKCKFTDLLLVVSHELGHKIEGGFKKNPPEKMRYFNLHEKKAEHYEYFTLNAYDLTYRIYKALGKNCKHLTPIKRRIKPAQYFLLK